MADEVVVFDAAGSNIDGTDPGSSLSVGPGTNYPITECSYPAPPLNVQFASSADTEGELPVSQRYGNRTITIKFEMVDAAGTLLAALQAKYGKLQREGGTLKRTMKNADVRIYDIIVPDGWNPAYDFAYYLGDLTVVEMTLQARPLSRGPSETLTGHTATSKAPLVFTETGIKGDAPGLGSLNVANATNAKNWAVWGIRSRYYSAASTAALFYEAETGVAGAAALNAGAAGASGGGANKVMRHSVSTTDVVSYTVAAVGTSLSHIGAYQVYARVQAAAANAGTVSLRANWQPGPTISTAFVQNATVQIANAAGTPIEGSWVIANLGQVSIPKVLGGTQSWGLNLSAYSTINADVLDIDWVALVPVTEGSGVTHSEYLSSGAALKWLYNGVQVIIGSDWNTPATYEGDYLLIPPAGVEARTLEMFAVLAGAFGGVVTSTIVGADNLDAIVGTLTYIPRYLT